MQQEPGNAEDIMAFTQTYGVEFPLFEKTNVNGPECHDLYKYMRVNSDLFNEKKNEVKEIPWNFAKFLLDEQG